MYICVNFILSFAISCCFCAYKTVIQIQCAFFSPVLSFANTCLQISELFFSTVFSFLIFLLFFPQCCLSFSSSGRCCCEKIKHTECREVCEQVSVDVSLHFHYYFFSFLSLSFSKQHCRHFFLSVHHRL